MLCKLLGKEKRKKSRPFKARRKQLTNDKEGIYKQTKKY